MYIHMYIIYVYINVRIFTHMHPRRQRSPGAASTITPAVNAAPGMHRPAPPLSMHPRGDIDHHHPRPCSPKVRKTFFALASERMELAFLFG